MVSWKTRQQAMVQQQRAMRLSMELDALSLKLYMGRPEVRTAIKAESDQNAFLRENRQRSEQALVSLVETYGGVENRGDDVVSFRSIPTIRSDATRTPLTFRLQVPARRPIWLKFGIHPRNVDAPADGLEGSEQGVLTDSPFQPTGPFESKLPHGVHRLEFTVFEGDQGMASLQVTLDDQVLASFTSSDDREVRNSGHSHISSTKQIDYDAERSLPTLSTYRVKLLADENQPEREYKFSAWLSDHSSSFASFPGAQKEVGP